jgi:hypothetical protein
MTKSRLAWLITISVSACHNNVPSEVVTASISNVDGFPNQIEISFYNKSAKPVCISSSEVEKGYKNVTIFQNNRELMPESSSVHMVKLYKSINIIDPIYVILPGETYFHYDVSDFALKEGRFRVRADFKVTPCSDLFDRQNPQWMRVPSEATLMFRPNG